MQSSVEQLHAITTSRRKEVRRSASLSSAAHHTDKHFPPPADYGPASRIAFPSGLPNTLPPIFPNLHVDSKSSSTSENACESQHVTSHHDDNTRRKFNSVESTSMHSANQSEVSNNNSKLNHSQEVVTRLHRHSGDATTRRPPLPRRNVSDNNLLAQSAEAPADQRRVHWHVSKPQRLSLSVSTNDDCRRSVNTDPSTGQGHMENAQTLSQQTGCANFHDNCRNRSLNVGDNGNSGGEVLAKKGNNDDYIDLPNLANQFTSQNKLSLASVTKAAASGLRRVLSFTSTPRSENAGGRKLHQQQPLSGVAHQKLSNTQARPSTAKAAAHFQSRRSTNACINTLRSRNTEQVSYNSDENKKMWDDDGEEKEEEEEGCGDDMLAERRQRILHWLVGVQNEGAERPITPCSIADDPPSQTDTAIHIVYKGD